MMMAVMVIISIASVSSIVTCFIICVKMFCLQVKCFCYWPTAEEKEDKEGSGRKMEFPDSGLTVEYQEECHQKFGVVRQFMLTKVSPD